MNASGASAGLGLVSAASWGGSDFVGGMGARRAPALLVVASGHIVSFLILLTYCLGIRLALPSSHYLLYAQIGGFEGSVALAIFYRALAMGAMGLTAALTGLLTALVPVVFSIFVDGQPSPLTALGLAAGLVAIWLITHSPAKDGPTSPPAALMLGALAGPGFGAQLILRRLAGFRARPRFCDRGDASADGRETGRAGNSVYRIHQLVGEAMERNAGGGRQHFVPLRSEEHTSELQ